MKVAQDLAAQGAFKTAARLCCPCMGGEKPRCGAWGSTLAGWKKFATRQGQGGMAAARFGMAYLLETGHYFAVLSGRRGRSRAKNAWGHLPFFVKNI